MSSWLRLKEFWTYISERRVFSWLLVIVLFPQFFVFTIFAKPNMDREQLILSLSLFLVSLVACLVVVVMRSKQHVERIRSHINNGVPVVGIVRRIPGMRDFAKRPINFYFGLLCECEKYPGKFINISVHRYNFGRIQLGDRLLFFEIPTTGKLLFYKHVYRDYLDFEVAHTLRDELESCKNARLSGEFLESSVKYIDPDQIDAMSS